MTKKITSMFMYLLLGIVLLTVFITFSLIEIEKLQDRLSALETIVNERRASQSNGNDNLYYQDIEGLKNEFRALRVNWETTEAKINNFDGMFKQFFEGD